MTHNKETNTVFFSELLSKKMPSFLNTIEAILKKNKISVQLLRYTKDIWCRDYMPVQVSKKKFVQFRYSPSYLSANKFQSLITNPEKACDAINIRTIKSEITLDGGNVIKSRNKVLITDKIFFDNKRLSKKDLVNELYELLEVEDIIIIPHQPNDMFGHADGMIRFIDENTVLLNDFRTEKKYFRDRLSRILKKHYISPIQFTYAPSSEKNGDNIPSAKGTYINYLHIGDFILLPTFNIASDDSAFNQLSYTFPNSKIETINCDFIASEGGVLNCITWNINT